MTRMRWVWCGLAVAALAWAGAAQAACPGVSGDVNGSGSADVVDAVCAVSAALQVAVDPMAGPPACVSGVLGAADANCDGQVSIVDVTFVVARALGQTLPEAVDADGSQCPDLCELAPTAVGAGAPLWTLEDFQPESQGFGSSYGLEAFDGVTVVALLASW